MYLANKSICLLDNNTKKVYELKLVSGKLTMAEVSEYATYETAIYLLNDVTESVYELKVVDGKLTMEEVYNYSTYETSVCLLNDVTETVYELKVVSGKLTMAEVVEVEIKTVSLLDYWMPILRNLKDFKEIAKAEEPELVYILEAISSAISNMFITTANETGISRFEKMMGIYPEEGESLETRRMRVFTRWNSQTVYTENVLRDLLTLLCGENGYILRLDKANYDLTIRLSLSNSGVIGAVNELLAYAVPANIVKTVSLYNTHNILSSYTHEQLAQYLHIGVKTYLM